MRRRPPRSTRTDTLFPYTTLFRSVGGIIGGAFATITGSLTEELIMPLVGWLFGGVAFSSQFILLGGVPEGIAATDYAAPKKAGVAMIGSGAFRNTLTTFLLINGLNVMMGTKRNTIIRPSPPHRKEQR